MEELTEKERREQRQAIQKYAEDAMTKAILDIIEDEIKLIDVEDRKNHPLSEAGVKNYYKRRALVLIKLEIENAAAERKIMDTTRASVAEYALYYYYLQEEGYFEKFDNHNERKIGAYKELSFKHGFSWGSFKSRYAKYTHPTEGEDRRIGLQWKIRKKVLRMLEPYPKAYDSAETEFSKKIS